MLRSMTGFGMGEASAGGLQVEVELGSVNRKQFDVRVSLPRTLSVLEPRVRERVQEDLTRGSVTATVRVSVAEGSRLRAVAVDRTLARTFIRELKKTARELNLPDDLTASALLRLPEVLQYRQVDDDSEKVWQLLDKALRRAIEELLTMRRAEGAVLAADLTARFDRLKTRLETLAKLAPGVPERYRAVLRKRLKDALATPGGLDEAIAREIVIFTDRSDISEEIVRLGSHFKQAFKLMQASAPAGRALDFVCQEMFREINTIGSKANDARISSQVILFKTELECVREQVQNIE